MRIIAYCILAMIGVVGPEAQPKLETSVALKNGEYEFSLKSTTTTELLVPPIIFGDGGLTGHWIYIYDPYERRLQEGFSAPFSPTPIVYGSLPKVVLRQGGGISESLSRREVEDYFFVVPECYYILYVYRKVSADEVVFSDPSEPLFVCGAKK